VSQPFRQLNQAVKQFPINKKVSLAFQFFNFAFCCTFNLFVCQVLYCGAHFLLQSCELPTYYRHVAVPTYDCSVAVPTMTAVLWCPTPDCCVSVSTYSMTAVLRCTPIFVMFARCHNTAVVRVAATLRCT
jgi:hypothetical protein